MKKVISEMGEFIASMPNSNACYFKLPIECNTDLCQLDGHFAVKRETMMTLEVCEFQQM